MHLPPLEVQYPLTPCSWWWIAWRLVEVASLAEIWSEGLGISPPHGMATIGSEIRTPLSQCLDVIVSIETPLTRSASCSGYQE